MCNTSRRRAAVPSPCASAWRSSGARLPRIDARFCGPILEAADRLVVPVTGGSLQVFDRTTREPLYRIDASRRGSRCATRDERLYVLQPDRTIDCFPQLR